MTALETSLVNDRFELTTCRHCGGEGGYEKHCMTYELGCGFAHNDSYWARCEVCNGVGEFINEYELEE